MKVQLVACREAGFPDDPPVGTLTIEDLCLDPSQLNSETGVDKLVLLLHRDRFDLSAVQRAVRSIGLDPLGVQIFEAGTTGHSALTPAGLEGLTARALAFGGSRPEHAKPVLASQMTRRSFLYPPTPEYVAAPFVDADRCAASSGCRACVAACPRDAYEWRDGKISHNLDACLPCGICATTCPTSAISTPSSSPSMIKQQVEAIIGASASPTVIRFVCSRGAISPQASTEDVTVPCTAMVPATWLLACLAAGAVKALSVPCGESGCPLQLDSRADAANRIARATLESAGQTWEDASVFFSGNPATFDGFSHLGAAEVIGALAEAFGNRVRVADEAAPMGLVEISDACTLCGQCAKVCPTGALMEVYDRDDVMISFDARLCVNCSQCTATCPEFEQGAIRLRGGFDSELLAAGPRSLAEAPVATCDTCGTAFAPTAMLGRVAELLGPEFEATLAIAATTCLDCRGR